MKQKIERLLSSRGILSKQLASEMGVSAVHLSYVVNGHRKSSSLIKRAVAFLSALPKKS